MYRITIRTARIQHRTIIRTTARIQLIIRVRTAVTILQKTLRMRQARTLTKTTTLTFSQVL